MHTLILSSNLESVTSCLTLSYSVPMHMMRKYNAKPQRICIFLILGSNSLSASSSSYQDIRYQEISTFICTLPTGETRQVSFTGVNAVWPHFDRLILPDERNSGTLNKLRAAFRRIILKYSIGYQNEFCRLSNIQVMFDLIFQSADNFSRFFLIFRPRFLQQVNYHIH